MPPPSTRAIPRVQGGGQGDAEPRPLLRPPTYQCDALTATTAASGPGQHPPGAHQQLTAVGLTRESETCRSIYPPTHPTPETRLRLTISKAAYWRQNSLRQHIRLPTHSDMAEVQERRTACLRFPSPHSHAPLALTQDTVGARTCLAPPTAH